ncbi:unnamed protein product [Dovyalis caffra]|uniref:Transposase n=1 Tax=Dovyalis caffra TaxID=77055 RepID=A0AAV1RWN9_9ROSI|nr:unnamed protein product [Dovyalis caffra]
MTVTEINSTLSFYKSQFQKGIITRRVSRITSWACGLHGHIELGEVVAKKSLEMEKVNVDKVRKNMREKGLKKEVGSSWIDIGGSVAQFVSKDEDHSKLD